MGSSLQRLEVLLIGLVVLIAGAVVAILLVLRPSSAADVLATPPPIAAGAVHEPSIPPMPPTSAPVQLPTAAPARNTVLPRLTVPPIVRAIWPWLLLAVGLGSGALIVVRRRRPRMPATHQNVAQLFVTADARTRRDNRNVMRDLAAQGVLTAELAAVAGIDLAQPHKRRASRWPRLPRLGIALSRITLPAVTAPTLRWLRPHVPKLPMFRRPLRLIRIAPARAVPEPPTATAHRSDLDADRAEQPDDEPNLRAGRDALPIQTPTEAARSAAPAVAAVELVGMAPEPRPATGTAAAPWTAEERALAVAQAIVEVWAAIEVSRGTPLQSTIVALDTLSTPAGIRAMRTPPVLVTIDGHPDEEALLVGLPDALVARRPGWGAAWRQAVLEVFVATDGAQPPIGGPLIIPVLAHGYGGKTTRCLPLATARHLGLYGAGALGALHTALGCLLALQPPSHAALAIIDAGEITPLYRDVAHRVPLPGSPRATIQLLAQAVSHGVRWPVRPLVLVVVEPDAMLLKLLWGIAARLRARPAAPVHLLIVQEHLRSAGRELYAMLPALITGGGQGTPALLPGQGAWPKHGAARLVGRSMRAEGRALALDEATIAALVADLRGSAQNLPPVLWDPAPSGSQLPGTDPGIPAPRSALIAAGSIVDATPAVGVQESIDSSERECADDTAAEQAGLDAQATDDPAATADDEAAQRRRIAQAITAHRQRLLEAAGAFSTVEQPLVDEQVPNVSAAASVVATVDARLSAQPASDAPAARAPAPGAQPLLEEDADAPADAGQAAPTDDNDAAPAAPPSRRAALFRATIDAGGADSPPLQLVQTRHDEPLAASPVAPATSALLASGDPPMIEPENGWPIGPAPLGRVALADLLARVVATPAIVAGQANELGVTKNRLVDLLKGTHTTQAKALAEILLAWFDLAGVLVAATKPGRLRHPRALATLNLAELAARLNATPCPDKATVTALWTETHEGRS
jgi:hypothetical protein